MQRREFLKGLNEITHEGEFGAMDPETGEWIPLQHVPENPYLPRDYRDRLEKFTRGVLYNIDAGFNT